MIKLAVLGATGRMGTRVLDLLADDPRFEFVAAITGSDDPSLGNAVSSGSRTLTVKDECSTPFDVLIDFSVPAGTVHWLEQCVSTRSVMVTGVTGFSEQQLAAIQDASNQIAILRDSNFSVGVGVLKSLVKEAAKRMGNAYDIEIIEHHHNQKIDAPSGTAVSLADTIVQATGRDANADVIHGRSGRTGVRPPRQIGVHAIRMGGLIGHHEVHFSGPGETLTLTHTAHTRDTFARGALQAAAWIAPKPPGLYTMSDVVADQTGG